MNRVEHWKEIKDQALVGKLDSLVHEFVEKNYWSVRTEPAVSRRWVIVPVEKGRHLERAEAKTVAEALQKHGYQEICGVFLERGESDPQFVTIAATEDGLWDFSEKGSGLAVALVPADLSFLFLFTGGAEYNLFAGPKQFIEDALGKTIESARSEFDEFADDPYWGGRLMLVSSRYKAV